MAQVSFLPDRIARPIDAKLEELGAQAALVSRGIRLRLQPDLYNVDSQRYEAWAGLIWAIELEDVAEGRIFREALGKLVAAFGDDTKRIALLKALEAL